MKIPEIHDLFLKCNSVCIDTRKIQPNCLFVALKGDNFDANTFAKEALKKGASYVIIDNPNYYINEKTILVDDSLTTLQKLSKYHRHKLKITIVALTGSNGKTTTKELIHAVLNKKNKFGEHIAKATVGNLNNHIGVPLTLLSFDDKTKIGIVEMGANHQKEIEFLCNIALPDYGYITNFGKAHLEGFGGIQGVIKGKSEMYIHLREHQKTAFINLDDPIQVEKSVGIKKITFGTENTDAYLNINKCEANPFVTILFKKNTVKSNLIGLYNANNINAAITMGKYFGVSDNDIKNAIENYIPENNRSQLINKNSNEIILDAYNANPSSMKVAVENFIQLDKKNKIVFLGDMFELGNESLEEHKNIVTLLQNNPEIICNFIGKDFYQNKKNQANFYFYESFDSFKNSFSETILNSMLLIKGSRGMALERILDLL